MAEHAGKIPIRTRLAPAAHLLHELCQRIDEGELLTPMFQLIFHEAKLGHIEAIDRARQLATDITAHIASAKQARDYHAECARRLEDALEGIKAEAVLAMQEAPDLPWRSSSKQKLSLCRNSQPSLKHNLDLGKKVVDNILSQEDIEVIPERYQKIVSYIALDTERLREDLSSGTELGWAKLELGMHCRGLVMKSETSLEQQ